MVIQVQVRACVRAYMRVCDMMFNSMEYTGNAQVYIEGPAVDSVCYGNTVSLTCSYPNIMDMVNPTLFKYISPSGEWAVNGTRIVPDGVTTSTQIVSSTAERLDVTLTREQFEDSLFYYSCYLVLYNGSRETSSDVEIDPPGEGVYNIVIVDINCAFLQNEVFCHYQCLPIHVSHI